MKLKFKADVWSWSLMLKFDVEVWSWSLKLKKFEVKEIWSRRNLKSKKFEIEDIWNWRNLKLRKFEVEEIRSWRNLNLKKFEVDKWAIFPFWVGVENILGSTFIAEQLLHSMFPSTLTFYCWPNFWVVFSFLGPKWAIFGVWV